MLINLRWSCRATSCVDQIKLHTCLTNNEVLKASSFRHSQWRRSKSNRWHQSMSVLPWTWHDSGWSAQSARSSSPRSATFQQFLRRIRRENLHYNAQICEIIMVQWMAWPLGWPFLEHYNSQICGFHHGYVNGVVVVAAVVVVVALPPGRGVVHPNAGAYNHFTWMALALNSLTSEDQRGDELHFQDYFGECTTHIQ